MPNTGSSLSGNHHLIVAARHASPERTAPPSFLNKPDNLPGLSPNWRLINGALETHPTRGDFEDGRDGKCQPPRRHAEYKNSPSGNHHLTAAARHASPLGGVKSDRFKVWLYQSIQSINSSRSRLPLLYSTSFFQFMKSYASKQ
jgi:hypothetical protein